MKIKLNDYIGTKKPFINHIIKKARTNSDTIVKDIIYYSVYSFCPVVILCEFYLDNFGENDKVEELKKRVVEFYQIEEIIK